MEQRGRQLVGGVQARREEEETGVQREGCMWIGEMEKGIWIVHMDKEKNECVIAEEWKEKEEEQSVGVTRFI